MKLTILYFARLKEVLGVDRECLESDANTVEELIIALRLRGERWAEELAEHRVFRVALNQEIAELTMPLSDGDEVAIFPPVTGG